MRVVIIGRSTAFYNTAECLIAAGHSIAAIVTAKEAREYSRTADDFKRLAQRLGCPFYRTLKPSELPTTLADVAVSINYPAIISEDFIKRFRLGVLNGHGGDLPKYRGNACHGWAILEGATHTAATVHKMQGGLLDSGDIIAKEYFALSERTKMHEILAWIETTFPVLFARALDELERNPQFVLEEQAGDGRRCYPMLPEDGAIDWLLPAAQIIRVINASSRPFTGAYCFDENQKVTIWDAVSYTGEPILAAPGQVVGFGAGYVDIAAGDGAIVRILEMTLPFSKIGSIRTRLYSGNVPPFNARSRASV